jgi:hypothetical protein
VGLGAVAWAGTAHATVVWTSTFESGSIAPEWTPSINATALNVQVLAEQVYTGKYACKITVHPSDRFNTQNRVDIAHQSKLTGEGKDMWMSGHYLMLADAGVRNEFYFWESSGSYQNMIDFWVEPKTGGGTTIGFGTGALGVNKLWSADFPIGKWHQIGLHVHWSVNPQIGAVDVWFDGQQVLTATKAQTMADGNPLYLQTGLHRKTWGTVVDTIYLDDFIEADSLADVKIGPPIGSEPDGGTSNDAGTDGSMAGIDGGMAMDSGGGDVANSVGDETGGGGMVPDAGGGATTGTDDASAGGGGADGGGAGATGNGASSSSGGCAISRARAPSPWLASVFALASLALVRRRRRR